MTDDLLRKVIQADRDAAGRIDPSNRVDLKLGKLDDWPVVQELARHRLAFASPTPEPSGAVVREALQNVVMQADFYETPEEDEWHAGYIAGLDDGARIARTALASLDAGSASS